jgi:hypothetical protein
LREPGLIGVKRDPKKFAFCLRLRQDRPGYGSGAETLPSAEFPHSQELGVHHNSINHRRLSEHHGYLGNSFRMARSFPNDCLLFGHLVDYLSHLVEQVMGDGIGDHGGSLLSHLLDVPL